MSAHFWLWLLYFIILLGGGWYSFRVGAARFGFGVPIVVALFLFVLCWIVAGPPLHALLR